jgi:methanogenic corrinoid protein MtbC1
MSAMSAPATAIAESDYGQYLEGLLAGDRERCAAIARRLRDSGIGIPEIYLNLIQRGLYDVGALWQQGRISVAVEHLATAMTERLLTLFHAEIFSGPRRERSVIIACADGEQHQLGGRMVADLFELHGWRGDFLGASTPREDLVSMVADRKPDLLGLSVSIDSNVPAMLKALDAVTAAHPELPIIVGGQAFQGEGYRTFAAYSNATYVASIAELQGMLADW